MIKSHKTLNLGTLLVCFCFIGNKVLADGNNNTNLCSSSQSCSCLNTPKYIKAYECPGFIAGFKNGAELLIQCKPNRTVNHSNFDFIISNGFITLKKLTIVDCPVAMFLLSNPNKLVTIRALKIQNSSTDSINDTQALLESLPLLEELEISFSQLDLSGNFFNNNPVIETLILADNSLKTVPPNVFRNLTRLSNLDLRNNEISNLPETLFFGLRRLKFLNLKMNKLTKIDSILFYDLQELEEIDLSHNEITGIHIEAFQRLVNLKVGNLSNNLIDFEGFSPFHSNLYLEKADFSHNRISHMANDLILNKIYLEELNLSYNEIKHVELSNFIAVSPHIKILLQNNQISTINFTNANLLQELNSLDENVVLKKFHVGTTVNLNDNPIICDCNLYDFIKYLYTNSINIQFQINRVKCVSPPILYGFPLSKVNVNMLTCELMKTDCPGGCDCNYRRWDNTVAVNCANRNLTIIPDLRMMTKNQRIELNLQGNLLEHGLQDQLGYENVTRLILSNNKIKNVTWLPPNLEVLEMEYNNLTFLSYEVIQQLNSSKVKYLVLGNNPWNCDCSALPFNIFLMSELASKQIDVRNIQCSGNQKLIIHLSPHDLCVMNKFNIALVAVIVSLIIVGLAVGAITIMICKSRNKNGSRLI